MSPSEHKGLYTSQQWRLTLLLTPACVAHTEVVSTQPSLSKVKLFPEFTLNAASILDHIWSFLMSGMRRSSQVGWLDGVLQCKLE